MAKEEAQNLPPALAELQSQLLKAEAIVEQKEEENNALKEQLKKIERRWIDYEMKLKSMEHVWQKHMASLQVSLHYTSSQFFDTLAYITVV